MPPKGKATDEKMLSAIMISTEFTFAKTAHALKEKNFHGKTRDYIMVRFRKNVDSKTGNERTVVFPFNQSKIDVLSTRIGGFDGDTVLDKLYEMSGLFGHKPRD